MTINSDSTPETTTGMEIIARDLPSYDEGLQDVASLPFGNGTGAEDEERLPADQPRTFCNRTNKIIFGALGGCLLVFVTGISSAAVTSSNIATSFNSSRGGSKSPKAPKSTKNPTASKQPKAKFIKVKVKGSPNPVGTAGPTGIGACLNSGGVSGVCCQEGVLCAKTQQCDAYTACLQDPASGPVLVGNWWLQPDVSNGEVYFTEDAVCGEITSAELNSRTRLQLWDEVYLGMSLDRFKKFSVDYNVVSTSGGSGGYLNFYLRTDGTSSAYFDCNFVYSIPNVVGTGTLEIFPYTQASNVRDNGGGDTTGCSGTPSILDYLADNPNAVMGVGNGELYTFVLNGGSTDQNNSGQEICWSDVSIQHYDNITGDILVTTYEFTTL